MAKYRRGRINDAVAAEAAVIVRDIKDPRLDGVMITVTGADVTPDLKYAKIFYSVMGEFDQKELSRGLRSAASFVRSRLAQSLNLRQTPEITFVYDESVERGAHISELLHSVASDLHDDNEDGDE
ncbi:MAG: 30S ribosome-binding factor RbfA [Ruminococcaceae bacterium]|nr:30S ribosome-binding factor RbfA [Oscillospiraceae bacterium]